MADRIKGITIISIHALRVEGDKFARADLGIVL